jgi:branched-chain amino acid:cation transporter, LIVCS family
MLKKSSWLTGLALFAMFFGAGNVTFPLLVGQYAGQHFGMAMMGLLLTAICVPVLCLLSMIMFNADYRTFFNRIGKWGGWSLIFLSLLLLGPFFALPRVVTVAHGAMSYDFMDMSLFWFALIFCVCTWILTYKDSIFTAALGYVLTPLLLIFCLYLVVVGLMMPPEVVNIQQADRNYFLYGLVEGYFTLDAVAALFFAGILLKSIKSMAAHHGPQYVLKTALSASLIGGGLLALVYLGLTAVAAQHGQFLFREDVGAQQILTALSYHLLPGKLGAISAAIVLLACLTTALALAALFADFMREEALKRKINLSYGVALALTLLVTFLMSTLGFSGLMGWVGPVIVFCYPLFIALSVCNLLNKLFGWESVKLPVFLVFIALIAHYLMGHFI